MSDLTISEKKEIFLNLVETQDVEPSVPKSYELVMKKYSITKKQLVAIEQQGLDHEWPPLS